MAKPELRYVEKLDQIAGALGIRRFAVADWVLATSAKPRAILFA